MSDKSAKALRENDKKNAQANKKGAKGTIASKGGKKAPVKKKAKGA